jgi:hypothetical protein
MINRRPLSILTASLWFVGLTCAISAESEQNEQSPPRIISRIPRQPVISQAIAAIGYSKRLEILEIEFRNGAIYRYADVPRSIYHGLMSADSKAHYFQGHIKGNFKSSRIRRWHTEKH